MKTMPCLYASCPAAHLTLTRTIRMVVYVLSIKSVPTKAMSLSHVLSTGGIPTFSVDAWSNIVNMNWIHALGSATKMISVTAFSNLVNKHSKGNALSAAIIAVKEDSGVTSLESIADPQPAWYPFVGNIWMNQNSTEEVDKQFEIYRNAVSIVLNHLGLQTGRDGLGFRGLTHREALSF